MPMLDMNDAITFFYADIVKQNNGCWLFRPWSKNKGYGLIHFSKKALYAHRFSYMIHKGKIGKGEWVCHECDTPRCVNPDHLFAGQPIDNVMDKIRKGRHHYQKRSRCKHGHKLSGKNVLYRESMGKARLCRACIKRRHQEDYRKKVEAATCHK